jgi:hypothetical protein
MVKLSISVTNDIAQRLVARAKEVANGNTSLLAETAFSRVLEMPLNQLKGLVSLHRLDRKAATRSDWMNIYWRVLGELMGQPNQDAFFSPYSPRHFGEFYAVLLLNHVGRYDDEEDPFIPYVGPQMVTAESPSPRQWTFPRGSSPVSAAREVAAKLREYGAEASRCGEVAR